MDWVAAATAVCTGILGVAKVVGTIRRSRRPAALTNGERDHILSQSNRQMASLRSHDTRLAQIEVDIADLKRTVEAFLDALAEQKRTKSRGTS